MSTFQSQPSFTQVSIHMLFGRCYLQVSMVIVSVFILFILFSLHCLKKKNTKLVSIVCKSRPLRIAFLRIILLTVFLRFLMTQLLLLNLLLSFLPLIFFINILALRATLLITIRQFHQVLNSPMCLPITIRNIPRIISSNLKVHNRIGDRVMLQNVLMLRILVFIYHKSLNLTRNHKMMI